MGRSKLHLVRARIAVHNHFGRFSDLADDRGDVLPAERPDLASPAGQLEDTARPLILGDFRQVLREVRADRKQSILVALLRLGTDPQNREAAGQIDPEAGLLKMLLSGLFGRNMY